MKEQRIFTTRELADEVQEHLTMLNYKCYASFLDGCIFVEIHMDFPWVTSAVAQYAINTEHLISIEPDKNGGMILNFAAEKL